MNEIFQALVKEAQFTLEMLGSGATQIRNANYAQKGIYFQSFTNLSTGLERIGKLCLMLDFYIESGGKFPDKEYMKREIGHNLEKLYEKSQEIISRRGCDINYLSELNDPIHQAMIKVLSGFARGDRYSNIDLLVGEDRSSDPVASWFTEVDMRLFESKVTDKKKQQIAKNVHIVQTLLGPDSCVMHSSETGSEINDISEASLRTGIQEAIGGFRQLFVLQIIRYWVELLRDLQYRAQAVGGENIPYFSEIFARFYNDDSLLKNYKRWDRD